MPSADLEIVEIMRWCDLYSARALFRIGILISHDNQATADQWQHGEFADQTFPACVVRMDSNRCVTEHGFRTGGSDGDKFAVLPLDRVAKMPELPIALAWLDLEIGNRGVKFRIPINQTLVAVYQTLFMQRYEDRPHGVR